MHAPVRRMQSVVPVLVKMVVLAFHLVAHSPAVVYQATSGPCVKFKIFTVPRYPRVKIMQLVPKYPMVMPAPALQDTRVPIALYFQIVLPRFRKHISMLKPQVFKTRQPLP